MSTDKMNNQIQNYQKEYPLFYSKTDNHFKQTTERYELAWKEARKAAAFLKKEYSAQKVFVFGSMTSPIDLHQRSDIDLAVSGIPDDKFFQAIGAITKLITTSDVDLVDIEDCKAFIKKEIMDKGVEI